MTSTARRRTVVGLVAATAASLVLAACGSSDSGDKAADASGSGKSTTVKIGVLNGSDTALALARSSGSLDTTLSAVGAKATYAGPFPAFAPAAEAIKAGAVDVTIGGLLSWVGAVVADPELEVFAYQPDLGTQEGIVATSKSGVSSIADLKGKKIAYNQAGTGEYLLRKALAKEGLSWDDVKAVNLPPADAATAFASGQVDAWATWGNFFATAATSKGAKVVSTGAAVDSHNDTVFVTTKSFAKDHPDALKAVFDALKSSADKGAADTSLYDTARKADGLSDAVVAFLAKDAPVSVEPVTADTITSWQKEADFWTSEKVIPSKVDVAGQVVQLG
ncbi:aliphatic sulfonate ABC transporter substrate-binding protein [Nocardioides sp. CER19]|uniref:aliphatic sulfonate ABC transporter substrate-binding protein n=1 Tax=Nocardioides sp. CER19 TaxID=3038538 RepID=UPI00244D669D|nr:aliphatic sulfonate ABC transporter substrate-binding protein [Nocardioides sp. CER19]MDH2415203.1 aliphatic sulfonate ABC transporter substrate-binding protein [Nocardioides sp. CER19]